MDPRVKNMLGKKCGLLTVTAQAGSIRQPGNSTATWECDCRCGNRLIVIG
jgi:hypothetical protein